MRPCPSTYGTCNKIPDPARRAGSGARPTTSTTTRWAQRQIGCGGQYNWDCTDQRQRRNHDDRTELRASSSPTTASSSAAGTPTTTHACRGVHHLPQPAPDERGQRAPDRRTNYRPRPPATTRPCSSSARRTTRPAAPPAATRRRSSAASATVARPTNRTTEPLSPRSKSVCMKGRGLYFPPLFCLQTGWSS